jgi:hypothetical protein
MRKIAEFSTPRVLLSVGVSMAFFLVLMAGVWVAVTDSYVPPYRSPEGQAIRAAIVFGCGTFLLVWGAMTIRATWTHEGAAVFILGDKVVLFNSAFFTTKPLTSIREVNITCDVPPHPRLQVVLDTGRSIHVPLGHLRGEPEVIRQRLWDEVQAAKARSSGATTEAGS